MIISYPILPGPTDEDQFSGYTNDSSGLYPASFDKRWHGGIHINAGENTIRAIADGTVVAYRQPTIPPSADHEYISHPLGYMSMTTLKKWTHDGFVLLRHETETGENRPAVFYSLYMHLSELGASLPGESGQVIRPENMLVYRRDPLGKAGSIYGNEGVFHFEIFAYEANMRTTGDARTAFSGLFEDEQSDAEFWGDLYFKIPDAYGYYNYSEENLSRLKGLRNGNPRSAGLDNAPLLGPLFVKVEYDCGNRVNMSFKKQDSLLTPQIQHIGQTTQTGYEYNILERARLLCPSCPSVGHDIARFSRILADTAEQAPEGDRLDDWQPIMGPHDAEIICNLRNDLIIKQSDADFPRWQGWTVLEEDNAASEMYNDSICDIRKLVQVMSILNPSDDPKENEGLPAPKSPVKRLEYSTYQKSIAPCSFIFNVMEHVVILLGQSVEVEKQEIFRQIKTLLKEHFEENLRKYLTYTVCKFPTEWSSANNATRYKRIKETYLDNKEPAYNAFLNHIQALQFWEDAGLTETNVWHFHPLRFIAHFKKCGWRSSAEIAQMFPRDIFASDRNATDLIRNTDATSRANNYSLALNKTMRRYGISTARRQAAFWSNGLEETMWFQKFGERGPLPKVGSWYGRGFMQLTWARNYLEYFRFRGRPNLPATATAWQGERGLTDQVLAWRDAIQEETEAYDIFDSAGFYWIWGMGGSYFGHALADDIAERDTTKAYGSTVFHFNLGFNRVCRFVNTGSPNTAFKCNGETERMSAYLYARSVLSDIEYQHGNDNILYHPEYFYPDRSRRFTPQRP